LSLSEIKFDHIDGAIRREKAVACIAPGELSPVLGRLLFQTIGRYRPNRRPAITSESNSTDLPRKGGR
jgi:hypothetical protein